MKTQRFGIEIEMTGITREHAAKIAAKFFGTHNYSNTALTDGYKTWSAFDANGRKWKFSRDVSIKEARKINDKAQHICNDDYKTEMVSPILTYEDMPILQELVRQLRHAGKIRTYITFCLAVSHQALTQKRASCKKFNTDNEKYTFRCWLLRLGLIGDEFKNCREHLMKALSGNSAWRHGAPTNTATPANEQVA